VIVAGSRTNEIFMRTGASGEAIAEDLKRTLQCS
jgi:hypothetical protein